MNPVPDSPKRYLSPWRWLAPLLILLVAVGVYANTLGMEFTLDDFSLVVNNPRISDPDYVKELFFGERLWRPLKRLSLVIDYRVWGPDRPWGFHATNIAFHAGACLALYALALRMGFARRAAVAAALIFAVHPVHVEAVANVSHRKEPMALLFSLLALLAYIKGRADKPTRGPVAALMGRVGRAPSTRAVRGEFAVWAAVFYLLAMLSKDVAAVMMPVMALVYEAALAKEPPRVRASRAAACFAGFAAVLLVFTLHGYIGTLWRRFGEEQVSWVSASKAASYFEMLPVAAKAFVMNTGLMIWPWPLYFDRSFTLPSGSGDPYVLGGLTVLALYVAALVWSVRKSRIAFFGLAWYGVMLLPVSHLIPLTYWFVAERFLYVPSVGVALLAGLGVEALWSGRGPAMPPRLRRLAGTVLTAGLVVILGGLTVVQNGVWRDNERLFRHTLAHNPRSHRALYGLGLNLNNEGLLAEAEAYYREALAEAPRYALARYGLAVLLLGNERFPEAIEQAHIAAELEPDDPEPWIVIGNAEFQLGRHREAVAAYRRVIEIEPAHANGLYNLANALYVTDEPEQALESLDRALSIAPDVDSWLLRGEILEELDRGEEAIAAYRRASDVAPNSPFPHAALGRLLVRIGRGREASIALERSLRLDPDQPELRGLLREALEGSVQ